MEGKFFILLKFTIENNNNDIDEIMKFMLNILLIVITYAKFANH